MDGGAKLHTVYSDSLTSTVHSMITYGELLGVTVHGLAFVYFMVLKVITVMFKYYISL